ncbi:MULTISPECIES: FAD-binding oxidoreductase [Prauserella salsuginis group]|uniref:FAD-binding oxidoreductase n=1 Tax=Prauserella salsuginis TaxID=387889 RepID=A0ABW6GB53_9PSEU|nr:MULTISPECIES: FAD-binding oxidoreductase [Prauserella salsuginis group]
MTNTTDSTSSSYDTASYDTDSSGTAPFGTAFPDLDGALRLPGDDGFEAACAGYQRATVHRPGCVVSARSTADVRAAVNHAAAHGLHVSAQVSGHGLTTALDGGVLVDLRGLTRVEVDPARRTARVEGGATWQHVLDVVTPHGLAPLSGSSPRVGAVPYTLGGGVGLLGRRYGYAADHVRALEVVTPDGALRRVTSTSESALERELFWALRGGGAGGGVVTAMEIDLVEVSEVYGGSLYVDVAAAGDVLERWRRWTTSVPNEVTSGVAMLVFPDVPGVPAALRGRHVAQLQICVATGGAEGLRSGTGARGGDELRGIEGMRSVERLCEAVPVLRDTLCTRPFSDSGAIFDEPDQPHAYRSRAAMLRSLDPGALARLPAAVGPAAPVMCVAGLRHLGGAFARSPRVAGAIGHREANYLVSVLSPVAPTSEATDAEVAALHADVLTPFASETLGANLSFSFGPSTPDEVRSAFTPATADLLVRLRERIDPSGAVLANHTLPMR